MTKGKFDETYYILGNCKEQNNIIVRMYEPSLMDLGQKMISVNLISRYHLK